jgi:endoglucanase
MMSAVPFSLRPMVAASGEGDTPTKTLPWLHVRGEEIVDDQGKSVILRGINLGGWLVEEMWMMPFETMPPKESPFKKITDYTSLWQTIESRFGKACAVEIRNAQRAHWLQDADFERIKAAGLNTVRLPFICDQVNEPGGLFPWIDWVLERAAKNGLYVVLDLHGAPGRQSDEHHTGKEKSSTFFKDYTKVQETVQLWTEIATRYRDCPVIAGYDLMNEPGAAQTHAQLYVVYEQLYRAIRQIDKKHIIFMEDGFKGLEWIPTPHQVGWENVSYSVHPYAFDAKSEDDSFKILSEKDLAHASKFRRGVPIYLGEFNVEPKGSCLTVHKVLALAEELRMSWSFWTYKMVTSKDRPSLWGLCTAKIGGMKINPFEDSMETILKKVQLLTTANFHVNGELLDVFQKVAKGIKPASEASGDPVAAVQVKFEKLELKSPA